MTKKLVTVGTILLLIALVAMAADAITGKWTMSQEGRNGGPPRVTTFDFKVDGAALTGAMSGGMGGGMGGGGGQAPAPQPISNGKVNGTTITFDVVRDMGGQSMTMKYEGSVSGDTIHFKITMPDMGNGPQPPREADAKRGTT